MHEETGQTTQEEIDSLRKQVIVAFNEIPFAPPVDPTDKTQVEAAIFQFLDGCAKVLKARNEYFLKSWSYAQSVSQKIAKAEDTDILDLTPKELFQAMLSDSVQNNIVFTVDNFFLHLLLSLVTLLIKSTSELDSMRGTMASYSEVMSKFKTMIEDKTTGKAVESWFNIIWERQVKRGVVQ